MSQLLRECERGVALGRRRGLDEVEVFGLRERGSSIEIEKGTLSMGSFEETAGFGVRVHVDRRVGFAYASTARSVPDALEVARKSARLNVRLDGFRFTAPARAPRIPGLHDRRAAQAGAEQLLDAGDRVLQAVAGVRSDLLAAGGGVHAGEAEDAVANSEGLAVHHAATGVQASIYVVQRREGVSSASYGEESNKWDVGWERVGERAARLAVESANPKPLERRGRLPCVVRPEAAADLLGTVTVPSLYGKPAHRGESFYSGKVGKPILHRSISLWEDATLPGGLGTCPFDDEGSPTRRRPIVARGILKTFLYDRHDAAQYGGHPTANAVRSHAFEGRSYKSPPSTGSLQISLTAPKSSTAKLIASLDDGLLVHDMMGVHTANTASGDFSVTASLVFRIKDGRVAEPLAPLSVAGNMHAALRKGIRMGDDPKPMGGAPSLTLPSILFEGFSVTP